MSLFFEGKNISAN